MPSILLSMGKFLLPWPVVPSERFKYNIFSFASMEKIDEKMEEKRFSKQLVGKTVVSKAGKRFGEVGDIIFEVKSGELIHLILTNPTPYADKLELEKDKQGNMLIPYSAVIASGDFLVIAEEDII
ncbi:MAG: hypothetical protein QS98_C0005G0102 [archaeon GW2011_AR3]|nr:MAG: hypothetical protein QS98_C0005G0102 [archaeon GW2011_AR3]